MVTIKSTFTPNQRAFLDALIRVTPKSFLESAEEGHDRDYRLLGIAQWALNEYNFTPPGTGITFDSINTDSFRSFIAYGTQLYILSMRQAECSITDISYNDSGLSISLDRVSKIGAAMEKVTALWQRQIENNKKVLTMQWGGSGLGTFRYQAVASMQMNAFGPGSSSGWNVP